MFIGHAAVGFASKRLAPRASLGVLMTAPYLLDLLWPVFLLLGWERVRIDPGNTPATPLDFVSYPWSHSLLMTLVWSAVFGGITFAFTRRRRTAWVAAALVILLFAYAANLNGPLPPNPHALALAALVGFVFVPWAFWIEHTRPVRSIGHAESQ